MLLAELGSGRERCANTERKSCHCAAEIRMWKLLDKCRNHATRDARYTVSGRIPVNIIFQMVRYHNFAQFSISYPASQIAAQLLNVTTEQHNGLTDETLSTCPKLINKENSRSEIWHYSAYKTEDKGEWTDLSAHVCKRCYRPKACCHRRKHIKSF